MVPQLDVRSLLKNLSFAMRSSFYLNPCRALINQKNDYDLAPKRSSQYPNARSEVLVEAPLGSQPERICRSRYGFKIDYGEDHSKMLTGYE